MSENVKIKELGTAHIRIDGGTQNRCEINDDAVSEYAEAIKDGATFPPVIVFYDGSNNWLADGFHRWHAANQAGIKRLSCEVRTGSRRDAILFSLGVNATHGLRRTNKDKRKAVETALNDAEWAQWSDREIANRCAVSHMFVSKMRNELSVNGLQIETQRTVQRNGKTYQQNTANIGTNRPQKPQPEPPQEEEPPLPEPPQWDDENDADPYANMDEDPFTGGDESEPTSNEPDPFDDARVPVVVKDTITPNAVVSEALGEEIPDEDDLTDDEWLATIPLFRHMVSRNFNVLILRHDMLAWRTLQQSKAFHRLKVSANGAFKNHTSYTKFQHLMKMAANVKHPKYWGGCVKCRARGCETCNYTGADYDGGLTIEQMEAKQ